MPAVTALGFVTKVDLNMRETNVLGPMKPSFKASQSNAANCINSDSCDNESEASQHLHSFHFVVHHILPEDINAIIDNVLQ